MQIPLSILIMIEVILWEPKNMFWCHKTNQPVMIYFLVMSNYLLEQNPYYVLV